MERIRIVQTISMGREVRILCEKPEHARRLQKVLREYL